MITLPNPSSLFISAPRDGAAEEGRLALSGGGSMEIGTYTKYWKADSFIISKIQPPDMPFEVEEVSYRLHLKTFVPLFLFDEIKRYDAISYWKLSYQEIMRHLALAVGFKKSQYWAKAVEIALASINEIWDSLLEFYDGVLSEGDFSFEHFVFYVKEHEGSASPFEESGRSIPWKNILENPYSLKMAHAACTKFVRDFVDFLHKNAPTNVKRYIDAKWCYPALRARPPEYQVLKQGERECIAFCHKWRDRKAGGIKGISQSTWTIFKTEVKKKLVKRLHERMSKVLGCPIVGLEEKGPQMYLDLLIKALNLYDLKTAEKQTGLLFDMLGFVADLSIKGFNAEDAGELYSGIGPTSYLNEWAMTILLKAICVVEGLTPHTVYYFSDNLAIDVELPVNVHFDEADSFCGFRPEQRAFGPASLCTDNPKHRLKFNGTWQEQSQHVQYIMRPFLSVMMNGLRDKRDCEDFLVYVVDKKLVDDAVEDEALRGDVIRDIILAKDRAVHATILDKFPQTANWVKDWFITQSVDPVYSSDLVVTP